MKKLSDTLTAPVCDGLIHRSLLTKISNISNKYAFMLNTVKNRIKICVRKKEGVTLHRFSDKDHGKAEDIERFTIEI